MQSLLRWLTVLAAIGLVSAGIVVLALGMFQGPSSSVADDDPANGSATRTPPAAVSGKLVAAERKDNGPAPATASAPGAPAGRATVSKDYLVIPECQFHIRFKQEVPSQRDGQLLYVATEPPRGEVPPPDRLVEVPETYAYVEIQPGEQLLPNEEVVPIQLGPEGRKEVKQCRRLRELENVDSTKIIIQSLKRKLRLLREGDEIKDGDLLALVDPMLAVDEFKSKRTKVDAAIADWQASIKTRDEAEQRYRTLERLYNGRTSNTVSLEDVRGGKLTWDRYFFEEIGKNSAITQAKAELNQALTAMRMHEIRSKVNGVVKTITKMRGEAVKGGEQVLVLQDYNRLRLEGVVDMQHIDRLPSGTQVVIEPSHPQSFRRVLRGHLQPIRSVAVAKNLSIVSASEDSTRVWLQSNGQFTGAYVELPHPASVLAVACSPLTDTQSNFCLTGAADGIGRLWNLSGDTPSLVAELKDGHRGAINAVAFSPDGQWLATGGVDRTICLWNQNGQRIGQPLTDGHRGDVTSVQFLSQTRIVSAAKDHQLILWTLNADGTQAGSPTRWENRTGDVTNLSVRHNPAQVLFDQGQELQLLSLPSGRVEGSLKNPNAGLHFTNMAQFSPDGNLVLTNAASEGRLQLWRVGNTERRSYELRQLVWPGDSVTCGAFAPLDTGKPDDSFIVTGTEDHQVVIWDMPSKDEEVEMVAPLSYIEKALDTSSRQVRIWADVDNKSRRLYPGATATMVIYFNKH